MTVKLSLVPVEVEHATSAVIHGHPNLIRSVVHQVLANHTESLVEMIVCDQSAMEAEDLTRAGIQRMLCDVKGTADSAIDDIVEEFGHKLRMALNAANYGACVTGIKYDLAGNITDIEVDVTVG